MLRGPQSTRSFPRPLQISAPGTPRTSPSPSSAGLVLSPHGGKSYPRDWTVNGLLFAPVTPLGCQQQTSPRETVQIWGRGGLPKIRVTLDLWISVKKEDLMYRLSHLPAV